MKKWLIIAGFFVLYWISGIYILDPDFGWEIPLGDYILRHGIPARDLFTYSMPSYPFVDHEWVTHAAIAYLYPRIGMVGLAGIFAAIATASLVVATRNAPPAWRRIIIILLGMVVLNAVSVRPQVISFLFFACIVQLILDERVWHRWKWYLPVYFFVWANLHGGFVIGIATVGLSLILRLWKQKKKPWLEFVPLIASIAATLVNPYGYRLWTEVLLSVFDTRLRYTVNEWMPTVVTFEPTIWFFVAVSISYMLIRYDDIDNRVKILFVVFLFLGISSYRNIQLFAIYAAAASTYGYEAYKKAAAKQAYSRKRFVVFHNGFFKLLVIGVLVHIVTLHRMNISRNTEINNYPHAAVAYLHTHPPKGNLLSHYEWGGYLLWKYPGHKVFVDGRMPSWRQDVSGKPKESPDASWEYLMMFNHEIPFKPVLERHGISSILVHTSLLEADEDDSDKKKEEVRKLREQMNINNMYMVYRDDVATLFERK